MPSTETETRGPLRLMGLEEMHAFERRVAAAARRSHALGHSVARRPWRCFDKSEWTACVVDAGGLHVCDATKADAELIVEAVNALAGEDTP